MRHVCLIREPDTVEGTFSHLVTDRNFQCYMLEPPWYRNERNYSCIPADTYTVRVRRSPKYGIIFHLTNVQGRSWILQHSGNWAGDTRHGFKTHSKGCQLFGSRRGLLGGQKAVFNSRSTKLAFERHMELDQLKEGEVAFQLHIMEVW